MPTDNQPKEEKPLPKGRARRYTDAELDALSQVTAEDIQRAQELVDQYGSERLKGLWRAKGTKGGRKK